MKPRSVSRSRKRKNKKCQQKQGDHVDQDPGNRKVSLSLDPQDAPQVTAQSDTSSRVEEDSQTNDISGPSHQHTESEEVKSPEVILKRKELLVQTDSACSVPGKESESHIASDVNEKVPEIKSAPRKTSSVQDEIEISRKEVFDIQDGSDKDNREIVEKSCLELSSSISTIETAEECRPVSVL